MQSSSALWDTSEDYRLVDEDQIFNYLRPKQLLGGTILIVLRSGRMWKMSTFAELAQISPGGWFKGIIRVDGEARLWGVLLCVTCAQFLSKRDEVCGYTRSQRRLWIDAYLNRTGAQFLRKKASRSKIAKDNGNLRRVREIHAIGAHEEQDWLRLVKACGGCCLRCGGLEITKDHIVPLARGGTNSLSNLQPLCRSCNSWKGTKTIDFHDYSSAEVSKLLRKYYLPSEYPGGKGQSGDDDSRPAWSGITDSRQRSGGNRIMAAGENPAPQPGDDAVCY